MPSKSVSAASGVFPTLPLLRLFRAKPNCIQEMPTRPCILISRLQGNSNYSVFLRSVYRCSDQFHAGQSVPEIPPEFLKYLPAYYTELLEHESDVMTTVDISRFTGYSKCAVNGWVKRGHLRAFQRGSSNLVPKVFLVEFFCSKVFRSTQRRNAWHIHAVQYFPLWVQCKTLKNAEQATE